MIKKIVFIMIVPFVMQGSIQVEVRSATVRDLEAVLDVDREVSFEYFEPLFLEFSDRSIGKNAHYNLESYLPGDFAYFVKAVNGVESFQLKVATVNQKIVGFVLFHCIEQELFVDLMMILKPYRRLGIATKIAQDIAAIPAITSVQCTIIKRNEAVAQLLQRFGFNVLDKVPTVQDFPADCLDLYAYYGLQLKKQS